MATSANRGVIPTAEAWRRTSAAVRAVENTPTTSSARRPNDNRTPVIPMRWAKVTQAVTSGAFATPGVGKARFYDEGSGGALTESTLDPVDVLNRMGGGSIALDVGVLLGWIGGNWYVLWWPCA